MTTADRLLAKGEAKGRADTLRRQLALKFKSVPDQFTRLIDTATPEQMRTWTDRIIDAASPEEVFAP
ncbi:hypothetical protein [Nocardia arthritidis]|uniref:DUF4351 domain-containing protein n=1 Tax=Nocardia arthritidis TaxID=228602 RepID=A0A6G9YCF7_9NOCA|nr:hypothetical protein [Nocardia arthritidis]QIS10965.1 hypothetical protein F5544_15410 [Nocardia arthritidis]